VRARVAGKQRQVTIGEVGSPRITGSGEPLLDAAGVPMRWTVAAARSEAAKLLGQMATGHDPHDTATKPAASGPTLRDALAFHLAKMRRGENRRGKQCSPRSIDTLQGTVELHLAAYLDRPIVDLTTDVIASVMQRIESETPPRHGSNPDNPPGRATANRVLANISALWRSYERRYGLPVPNPTMRLQQAALKPRETRISDGEFADWHAKVLALANPVRRDLQLVGLFTGIRSDGLCHLRWDDIDFDDDLIYVARAKGDKPYSLPLVKTVRDILENRKRDNAANPLLSQFGGDQGWCFPSFARDGKNVIAVAEPKERRNLVDERGAAVLDDDGEPVQGNLLPGIHVSRRTFNSVASEIGIEPESREALMNHAGRGVNVRHYVQTERLDHLRTCAEKIEAALWDRIRNTRPAKRSRRKLQSVA
jgi:integrase